MSGRKYFLVVEIFSFTPNPTTTLSLYIHLVGECIEKKDKNSQPAPEKNVQFFEIIMSHLLESRHNLQ